MSRSFFRSFAVFSIIVLVVLSWLPSSEMVRTGLLPPWAEHFAAYMASALLVAATMPRFRFVQVACFYAVLASLLEWGQNFVPGRDPEVITALISMLGAVSGEILARMVTGVWQEKYGFPPRQIPPGPVFARAAEWQSRDQMWPISYTQRKMRFAPVQKAKRTM